MDWNGGSVTYDGLDGIDFALSGGFQQMDDGVEAFAAASGVVSLVEDGHDDRWSHDNPNVNGELGNFFMVRHEDGVETRYWHFRTNFIVVERGEEVWAGQLVGSSGNSTGPHFHFEAATNIDRQFSKIVTYLDKEFWWKDPLQHPDALSLCA